LRIGIVGASGFFMVPELALFVFTRSSGFARAGARKKHVLRARD
jgi:hypothetical protein